MSSIVLAGFVLTIGSTGSIAAASDTKEDHRAGASQGITLDDIGRGLKSAAKNIGDEIPKIGPAIGETFKKITTQDNAKEQKSTQSPPQRSNQNKKQTP